VDGNTGLSSFNSVLPRYDTTTVIGAAASFAMESPRLICYGSGERLEEIMTELQQMLEALKRPEYVHVLLNPLPIYGMVIALVALVLG